MEIPENLTPRIKEILSRHVHDVPTVEGEKGHLVTSSEDTPLPTTHLTKRKSFTTFIENSLPPGDRE